MLEPNTGRDVKKVTVAFNLPGQTNIMKIITQDLNRGHLVCGVEMEPRDPVARENTE
jgi:hypothetical protein